MPTPDFFAESPESVGIDPAKLEALFERAAREVEDGNIGSCQIAIARDGKLAALRSYGSVTHEGRPAPATNETLYVVFSCTKAILSAAGWLLLQEGKLGLDERVAEIVPEFGTNGKDRVTVEQLFLHTAGFPNAPYPPSEWSSREKRLARFSRWRLEFEPGSRFWYHPTSGMWVIAELVERRSGMDYRDFVRARIAEPLGLPDLRVGLPREHHGRLADIEHRRAASTPEERRAAGWPEVIPETEVTEDAVQGFNRDFVREAGVPGGGACTSAGDLALFYQALLSGEALDGSALWTPETLALARTVRTGDLTDPLFGVPVQRGLGIVVAGDDKRVWRGFGRTGSEHMFGHDGAGGQIAWGDPVSGISFAFCTNGFDRHELRQARRGVALSSRAAACLLD
ncbi:MAG TPA: serine hydrolase domain-containing protein [Myxococcota bacterium]|nr:serine hydrolase domain-containing protein [Myxococcota bacterium]